MLASARRDVQLKIGPVVVVAGFLARFTAQDAPALAVIASAVALGLIVHWIRNYRALRRELKLDDEHDDLDHNATMGLKTIVALGAVFVIFFGILFALMSSMSPTPR